MNTNELIRKLTPQERDFLLQIITGAQEAIKQRNELLNELESCEAYIRLDERESAENRSLTPDYGYSDSLAALIASVKGGAK